MWQMVVGIVAGLLFGYAMLLVLLWWAHRRNPDEIGIREGLLLLPDLVRLLKRLTVDDTLPRGVRVRIVLALLYLASPIDLVPDFVPVLGYADDAIIVVIVLRSVMRRAGAEAIERHWPGTPEGLRAIRRVARL